VYFHELLGEDHYTTDWGLVWLYGRGARVHVCEHGVAASAERPPVCDAQRWCSCRYVACSAI